MSNFGSTFRMFSASRSDNPHFAHGLHRSHFTHFGHFLHPPIHFIRSIAENYSGSAKTPFQRTAAVPGRCARILQCRKNIFTTLPHWRL